MNIDLNNAKKLLHIILFLFITMFFQIIIIIKLNSFDNKLLMAADRSNITKEDSINDKINEPSTEISSEDIIIKNDYSDIDEILSDENLNKYFNNSLFIGDSRTEGLRKFTELSKYASFCCDVGININTLTTDTFFINGENISLYDSIQKYKFDKIFICIGYNELGWQYEDTFIEKYIQLTTQIKSINPDTHVIIFSILHISSDAYTDNESENNERIDLYNTKIKEMCKNTNVEYVDLNNEFTDKAGFLISESTADGIHFTNEYYRKYLYKILNFLITKDTVH